MMNWTIYIDGKAVKIVQAATYRKAWKMACERNSQVHTSRIRVEQGP